MRSSRRDFLKWTGIAGAGLLAGANAGCGSSVVRKRANPKYGALPAGTAGEVHFGFFPGLPVKEALPKAMDGLSDMKWLTPGQSVLIKPAVNSGNDHPAVTHPDAIIAMVAYLKKKGAGKVYVGDQSGVGHVRRTKEGRVSSTTELMKNNGLFDAIQKSGAELHNFDDQGWGGYYEEKADFPSTWPDGTVWLPKIVREVDHIINLPRLSAHALAGYTLGVKNAIGYLRDDSRMILHQKADTFFEKYAEINHMPVLRKKLRLTVTVVDKVLLDIGPDIGGEYDADGSVFLGSNDIAAHDYAGARLMPWFQDQNLSMYNVIHPYPGYSNFANRTFVGNTWGDEAKAAYTTLEPYELKPGMAYDVPLSHLAILRGRKPDVIKLRNVGAELPASLAAHLKNEQPQLRVV